MDTKINTEVRRVAERIQAERQKKHMSQMDLALEAGISQGFLAMIEANRKVPTIATIFKIAKALDIRPAQLFEDNAPDREKAKKQIISLIQKNL
jgi:transcriptional regulator with XRE-family HTH domain